MTKDTFCQWVSVRARDGNPTKFISLVEAAKRDKTQQSRCNRQLLGAPFTFHLMCVMVMEPGGIFFLLKVTTLYSKY